MPAVFAVIFPRIEAVLSRKWENVRQWLLNEFDEFEEFFTNDYTAFSEAG